MKIRNTRKIAGIGGVLILAVLAFAGFTTRQTFAQTDNEKQIRDVLTKNTTAFEQNALATLDKIRAND